MKNKIIQLLFSLFTIVSFAQSEEKASTQATFGRFSDCFSGRGICSFNAIFEHAGKSMMSDSAQKLSDKIFVLEISRLGLFKEAELRIAGKSFSDIKNNENLDFVQIDPLVLSESSLKALNINPKYNTIIKGNYPMEITKDKIKIVFTLKATD